MIRGDPRLRIGARALLLAPLAMMAASAAAAPSVYSTSVDFVEFSVGTSAPAVGLAGSAVALEVAAEATGPSTTAEDDVFESLLPNIPPPGPNLKVIDDGGIPPPPNGVLGIVPLPPVDLTIRTAADSADVDSLSLDDPLSLDLAASGLLGMYVQFSVDNAAVGIPGAPYDVASEAALGEASGDVFESPVNGLNGLLVDEGALHLTAADDLDGLIVNEPISVLGPDIDTSGDGVPDVPMVYFTLRSAATMPAGVASGADICIPGTGSPGPTPATDPAVVHAAATMQLVAGDDIDGLYLDHGTSLNPLYPTGYAVVSLAPGSPSLATIPATPSDLILVGLNGLVAPVVIAQSVQLGLLATDNLNALNITPFSLEGVTVPVGLDSFEVD